MSISSLKRNDLSKLTKALEELGRSQYDSSNDDTRFWIPSVDKAGNGYAVIHFLPTPEKDGESGLPWVKKFSHGFQGPGGWYIDECPTTLNKECPVCQHNKTLWDSGVEANRDIVRKQKRKLSYIANVYIMNDPAMPENEKKVKLFKFGKKIFDKLNEAMTPQFQDEKPMNPFHLYEGAPLKVKIRNVEGYRNYDKSEFGAVEPLSTNDSEIEKIWKSEYSLMEFVDPKQYKEYDVLKKKLNKVLGLAEQVRTVSAPADKKVVDEKKSKTIADEDLPMPSASLVDDDDINYFQKLADEE